MVLDALVDVLSVHPQISTVWDEQPSQKQSVIGPFNYSLCHELVDRLSEGPSVKHIAFYQIVEDRNRGKSLMGALFEGYRKCP